MTKKPQVEVFSDVKCSLGEGPYWNRRDAVWLADIEGRRLHRLDWSTQAHESFAVQESVCYIGELSDGRQLVGLERSVAAGRLPEFTDVIALPVPPSSRVNDGGCDPNGRLFLGTTDREYRDGLGSLLKVTTEGATTVLQGLSISNGLAWTSSGTSMIHIDTLRRAVFVYPYDIDDGCLAGKPRVLDLSHVAGLPDGCAVDEENRVWVAMYGGGQLLCLDAGGRLVDKVQVPAQHVTSCCFAGEKLDELVITSASPPGDESDMAGRVFVYGAQVRGAELAVCASL